MKKIIALLLAMVLMAGVFTGCANTEEPAAENNAVLKIGDKEFTLNEFNFMYIGLFNQVYSNLASYYGDYLSSVVDITKPLEEQMIDDTTTWHEYIVDYSLNSLLTNTAVYEAAMADESFSIPEDMQQDLDTLEEQMTSVAEENGYTLEEYIGFMYGEGMDFESILNMTEFQYIAYAYQDQYYNAIEVPEEEMKAYYEENKKDLDTVNFRYYSAMYSDEEGALTQEEAKAQADTLAEVHTAEEFNALVYSFVDEDLKAYFEEGDATLFPGAGYADTGIDEVSEWLFDEARKQGDTMVHFDESVGSYLAIMFEERVSADYNYVDVRHVLVMPEEAEDGTKTEEAWTAAEAKAAEVLAEYLEGEMTEESFAELAKKYSEDGNAATGGLYENVYKGQMVTEFNDWCFDPARQVGDTGVVKTRFGYHVMYFNGIGDSGIADSVKPILTEQYFNEWVSELCAEYSAEETELFSAVGGMIDDIVNAANAAAEEKAAAEAETGNVTNEEVVGSEGETSEEEVSAEG
ncbi:MAG: peptidylprolyl isomerase [Oscillospiraceae bacterium]|nr:peptidylprolyl isomerase [Oscillospiraceae bacterium]